MWLIFRCGCTESQDLSEPGITKGEMESSTKETIHLSTKMESTEKAETVNLTSANDVKSTTATIDATITNSNTETSIKETTIRTDKTNNPTTSKFQKYVKHGNNRYNIGSH